MMVAMKVGSRAVLDGYEDGSEDSCLDDFELGSLGGWLDG